MGKMEADLVTLANLLLCLAIVALGLLGYRRSKHTLPLMLAMVFAFAGRATMLNAYQEAIRERYRFYSYGDAMLVQ